MTRICITGGDFLRGLGIAAVLQALHVQLPPGSRVEDVRVYSDGSFSVDWSTL